MASRRRPQRACRPVGLSAAMLLLLLLVARAAIGLLMLVMRALLRRAMTLRAEMEAVV